jgi:hypothetical protein
MSHIELKSFLAVTLAVAVSSPSLFAADSIETHWNEVCRVANGRELVVTTAQGETVQGYCMSIDVNGVGIQTKDGKVAKIARTTLTRLEVYRSKGHQLSSLGKGVRAGLKFGWESLFSPLAPVGLVTLPGTLAWGAFAAPFCVVGDLKYRASGKQEIKVL